MAEQKQFDPTPAKLEQNYRRTLESMMEGCQIIGFDWRYLFVNDSAAVHAKKSKRELLGRTMIESYPGIDKTEMFSVLQQCMADRTHHRMENKFTYPDGSVGWFELSIQPSPDGILILSNDITERKRAQARTETQLKRLEALREIDISITSTLDLRLTLNVLLDHTIAQLAMDAASVLLLNPFTFELTYAAGRGFRMDEIEQSRVRLGNEISSRAIQERDIIHISNPMDSPDFTRASLLVKEGFAEFYSAPMIAKGHVVGTLEVFHRSLHDADKDWRSFLKTLAGQAAIAVDNAQLFENLQRSNMNLALAYDATIEGWSRALDLRDRETEGHTQRVAQLTVNLARAMGMPEEELVHVRRGALLHDIGKMGIPDDILHKPGKLTEEEWAIMRLHPQLAYNMLSAVAYLQPALEIPYCHHEKWDGTGYPRGLKGIEIPLTARIFAVVDVWDALRSRRPYREAWPEDEILKYLAEQTSKHFDPDVVAVFLQLDKSH